MLFTQIAYIVVFQVGVASFDPVVNDGGHHASAVDILQPGSLNTQVRVAQPIRNAASIFLRQGRMFKKRNHIKLIIVNPN